MPSELRVVFSSTLSTCGSAWYLDRTTASWSAGTSTTCSRSGAIDDVLTPPFRAKTDACPSDDRPDTSLTMSEDAVPCALATTGTTSRQRRAMIATQKSFTVSSVYERSAYEWNEWDVEHVRTATHDLE